MLRIIITFLSLLLAVLIIFLGLRADYDTRTGDLLLNLGSEIIGIALTVAIVEWLFERRQTRNEARKMSWRILLGIDHAVWVWQGGSREFRIEELLGLLSNVTENDPLPDFTQNLLLNMGSTSQNTLKHEPDVVHASSNLENALMALIPLSRLRDQENLLPPKVMAKHLLDATTHLAKELKIAPTIQSPEEIAKIRNPAAEVQEWRHYGKVL
jgi:hypothetical protein